MHRDKTGLGVFIYSNDKKGHTSNFHSFLERFRKTRGLERINPHFLLYKTCEYLGGSPIPQLGKMKFVDVREFKGMTLIDIREYYEDKNTGELKPGKKGISLQADQWEVRISCAFLEGRPPASWVPREMLVWLPWIPCASLESDPPPRLRGIRCLQSCASRSDRHHLLGEIFRMTSLGFHT